jgi:hypothetical protein
MKEEFNKDIESLKKSNRNPGKKSPLNQIKMVETQSSRLEQMKD